MTRRTGPRPAWVLMTIAAALAALPALVAPAHAVPPDNDAIAGATVVPTDPSTREFDTTDATADPTDGRCVGERSVWFRFDASETRSMRMTTAGSDYDTRLAIFRGPRNHRSLVDCDNNSGPGNTSADQFRILAGERYWVAVSACCATHEGRDGVLTIGRFGTPGAEIVVTGARSGEVSGRLFVDGTITCLTPSEVFLRARASQRVDDAVARGTSFGRVRECGSEPTEWTLRVDSETGWAFQPGPVAVTMTGLVWDGISRARARTVTNEEAVTDPTARVAR